MADIWNFENYIYSLDLDAYRTGLINSFAYARFLKLYLSFSWSDVSVSILPHSWLRVGQTQTVFVTTVHNFSELRKTFSFQGEHVFVRPSCSAQF